LTSDEAKSITHDHNASPKGVHTIRRKLHKAGNWDDIQDGLVTLDVIDGVHLKPKKGDDVTKVVDQDDEKDESIQPSNVTSNVTSTTKKVVKDVQSDLKKRSTQPSTPKGGQLLSADQLAQLLELPEDERCIVLSLISPKKPPSRSKVEKQKILNEIGDDKRGQKAQVH
jgi:hypothetical protein